MNKKDILIIDDDLDFTEYAATILKKDGFNVRSAISGELGINSINKKRPDLVIMDVMMSNMTEGFDLTKELKENEKYKDIPIIIMTAMQIMTDYDDKRKPADWLPGDAYIEKPGNPKELLKKIKDLLTK